MFSSHQPLATSESHTASWVVVRQLCLHDWDDSANQATSGVNKRSARHDLALSVTAHQLDHLDCHADLLPPLLTCCQAVRTTTPCMITYSQITYHAGITTAQASGTTGDCEEPSDRTGATHKQPCAQCATLKVSDSDAEQGTLHKSPPLASKQVQQAAADQAGAQHLLWPALGTS